MFSLVPPPSYCARAICRRQLAHSRHHRHRHRRHHRHRHHTPGTGRPRPTPVKIVAKGTKKTNEKTRDIGDKYIYVHVCANVSVGITRY